MNDEQIDALVSPHEKGWAVDFKSSTQVITVEAHRAAVRAALAAQEVPNAGGAVAVPVALFEQCAKALRDFSQAPTDYHRSVLRMRDALSALAAAQARIDALTAELEAVR